MPETSAIIRHLKNLEEQTHRLRNRQWLRKKIRTILTKHPELNQPLKEETIRTIRDLFGSDTSLNWHKAYSAFNGREDARYLPEDLFYCSIEPSLNRMDMTPAYSDKNRYGRLFQDIRQPETVLRNVWGRFYDAQDRLVAPGEAARLLAAQTEELLIKPSIDSGGGRNVRILEAGTDYEALFKQYGSDFLVQKVLDQSDTLAGIHRYSVNTIRILTCRQHDSILVLSSVVRFGRDGKRLDNQTAGGISCGLTNGRLRPFAVDKYGGRYGAHPDSGVPFAGVRIPGVREAEDLACRLHQGLDYFRLISWDMAIGKDDEPLLIEMNLRFQEINFHQFNNGPVFAPLVENGQIQLNEK